MLRLQAYSTQTCALCKEQVDSAIAKDLWLELSYVPSAHTPHLSRLVDDHLTPEHMTDPKSFCNCPKCGNCPSQKQLTMLSPPDTLVIMVKATDQNTGQRYRDVKPIDAAPDLKLCTTSYKFVAVVAQAPEDNNTS